MFGGAGIDFFASVPDGLIFDSVVSVPGNLSFDFVVCVPGGVRLHFFVSNPGGVRLHFFVSDPGGVTTVWSLGTRTGISITSSFLSVVVSSTGLRNLRLHRCDRTLFFRGVSGLTVLEMTMGEMTGA